jgi:cytochrome c peroxidase
MKWLVRGPFHAWACAALAACGHGANGSGGEDVDGHESPLAEYSDSEEPIAALPRKIDVDPRQVDLGKRLFVDAILSHDGKVSCLSCHPFSKGGADGKARADLAARDTKGKINVTTIFNVPYNATCHWSGEWDTMEGQLDTPVTSKAALATDWPSLVRRVRDNEGYRRSFEAVWDDGVTETNIRRVLVAYEKTLITPDARFDRWLAHAEVLTDAELEGYQLFKSYGCVSCHQGVNVGGNMFEKLGVMGDYFAARERDTGQPVTEVDYGRFRVTKREEDRYVFRVPSLRNVDLTAPYFHDGSTATLEEAIRTMGRYQLGRELDENHIVLIAAFLRTLDGVLPEEPG